MEYDIVIGLEIHAELKTNTKVFCSCKNSFGDKPNSNCCPVCVGLPGALPILNKKAVELAIKAGLSTNCDIIEVAEFERKNYFYPDLSKTYQISQLEKPLCLNGHIILDSGKKIRLNRIHLEEDAGKLIHNDDCTYVDYNRGGVPLIESVTEPDISNADEAVEFVTKLRKIFTFANIADCKMEQGGMRCDINVSVKPKGSSELGTRTEMKNINSFKMIKRAIEFESARQIKAIEKGETIKQQTRKWNDEQGRSYEMRSKEEAQDYRYFPDPDLKPIFISREYVQKIKDTLPELPEARKKKYINDLGLPEYDSDILISERFISDYFEECLTYTKNAKAISNWIMVEILKLLKDNSVDDLNKIVTAKNLAEIINMVDEKTLTNSNAKKLMQKLIGKDLDAKEFASKNRMLTISDTETLIKVVEEILAENQNALKDYSKTPDKVLNFFVGQAMRKTRGSANTDIVKELLIKKLSHEVC